MRVRLQVLERRCWHMRCHLDTTSHCGSDTALSRRATAVAEARLHHADGSEAVRATRRAPRLHYRFLETALCRNTSRALLSTKLHSRRNRSLRLRQTTAETCDRLPLRLYASFVQASRCGCCCCRCSISDIDGTSVRDGAPAASTAKQRTTRDGNRCGDAGSLHGWAVVHLQLGNRAQHCA